jgi:hypothetical protein
LNFQSIWHAFAGPDLAVERNLDWAVEGTLIRMSDHIRQRFVDCQNDRSHLRIPKPKYHGNFANCGAYRAEQLGVTYQRQFQQQCVSQLNKILDFGDSILKRSSGRRIYRSRQKYYEDQRRKRSDWLPDVPANLDTSGNLNVHCHGTAKLASWELLFLPDKAAKHPSSAYFFLDGTYRLKISPS